ncbi:AEC family transporter [Psychromarinibacter sp. C21-152]|uniref:AEC family transporter n=1 Tax=Psychromarinibacter sediminicola TaxID=3033385 RepID=A0AAE3NNU6_9RHOB|nr:AEC family transporter [Psychromarinibacter sediminicola]MDF0599326.1 AEC family transporter [Psychromarinibacter sediminicola]
MVEIFLKTLPFFLLIGVGYVAAATRFFSEAATAALTRFVFYFALSAMLFRFSANLRFGDVFDPTFMLVYLAATATVYVLVTAVAMWRRLPVGEAAVEAQCATIGNIGFLGIPMLALLMGEAAVGFIMMMLAVDLLVFGSLIVILITGSRAGLTPRVFRTVGVGLVSNPMLVAIFLGFTTSALALPIPGPVNEFLALLGDAATPGALFAIGASLAGKSAERLSTATWLSFGKLVLHPGAIAIAALVIWPLEPYAAAVMIASAALPTAGNIYMIAAHYGVAPHRVSTTILISTAVSILTVSLVLAWLAERTAFQ